jgi:hypothetical protein
MKQILLVVLLLVPPEFVEQAQTTGVITGRLLSVNGDAAAGIRVSALEAPNPSGQPASPVIVTSAETDGAGRYRLENIPPGRYYIIAGLLEAPTYHPGVIAVTGATVIAVRAGATFSASDFPMVIPAGFKVSGRVVPKPGSAMPASQPIALLPRNTPGTIQEGVIKPDGTFEFLKVRPGVYLLLAPFMDPTLPFQQATLTVIDKDVAGIEITAPVMVEVRGRVAVDGVGGGASPAGFAVIFSGAGRFNSEVRNGMFQAALSPGDYRIAAGQLPAGYFLKSITAGSADIAETLLKIQPGAAVDVVLTLGVRP